jgi:hypothetical protein
MDTYVRPAAAVFFVTLGVLLAGCASNSTAPSSTSGSTSVSTSVPALDYPSNNTSIPQNNAAIGCSLLSGVDALRGLGFQIQFHWTALSMPNGVVGYELYVKDIGADLPLLDTSIATSDFTETQCNDFVADVHLQGWQWRVRAKDAAGQFTDWTPWTTFQFSPCRLSDGTPCRAPG